MMMRVATKKRCTILHSSTVCHRILNQFKSLCLQSSCLRNTAIMYCFHWMFNILLNACIAACAGRRVCRGRLQKGGYQRGESSCTTRTQSWCRSSSPGSGSTTAETTAAAPASAPATRALVFTVAAVYSAAEFSRTAARSCKTVEGSTCGGDSFYRSSSQWSTRHGPRGKRQSVCVCERVLKQERTLCLPHSGFPLHWNILIYDF